MAWTSVRILPSKSGNIFFPKIKLALRESKNIFFTYIFNFVEFNLNIPRLSHPMLTLSRKRTIFPAKSKQNFTELLFYGHILAGSCAVRCKVMEMRGLYLGLLGMSIENLVDEWISLEKLPVFATFTWDYMMVRTGVIGSSMCLPKVCLLSPPQNYHTKYIRKAPEKLSVFSHGSSLGRP